MRLSHSTRFLTVVVALFSLLFMQLAVAAYACPEMAPAHPAIEQMRDAAGAPMANCAGMDKDSPSLCHAHSQAGKQSLDKPATPSVPPFAAAGLVTELFALNQPLAPQFALPPAFLMAPGAAPPIAIRNCCFRI